MERRSVKKKLFDPKGQPHGTVVLNWHGTPEEEFSFFAQAFHLTAREAVSALRQDRHFGLYGAPHDDFRAYPIIFMYRHALELYMKAVILVGAPMLSVHGKGTVDRARLIKTHNLDKLRQDLERVFDAFEWDGDLGLPHFKTLEDVRKVIVELHSVDAGSHAFRYPIDTKGGPSLASHFRFNLFDLCGVLDELFELLEGAAIAAYEMLQSTYEARAEARQYESENSDYGTE